MMSDVLIRDNILTKLDRSEGDVTALPEGASLICEKDWIALVGDQDELEYIESMGYQVDEVGK